ncbi:MAG TPA: MFS transporter [Jatrophihabitantaceae bacterium]|nr:MFS transporter [Jatrophihabitantaceae bacterium]
MRRAAVAETTWAPSARSRVHPWVILVLVCGVQFMVILDLAVVNVALPSIQKDLGLDQADLQWVVITYGLMLGGFLLLGGRAADLLGRRRVLLAGLALFTISSFTAGLAGSLGQLVVSRAGQGLGGALAAPAALSILVSTFAEGPERTKALGVFGAVGGSAASVGVIASGLLTTGPGWVWIFLVNVPIGVTLVALIVRYIPAAAPAARGGRADVFGALTVTAGLIAVVYAINKSIDYSWTSGTVMGFGAAGIALLASFVLVERRAASPLLPLAMLRRPTLSAANLAAALVFGSFFATIFQASLFMQQVLHYSPLRTGVAYLAMALVSVVAAAGVAPRVLGRLGAGWTLALGQASSAVGLVLLANAPADAAYWADVFPGFALVGIGIGFSAMSVQVAAFIGVEKAFTGLAGGMVETAREVGGALGIAVVASVALARADDVLAHLGGGPAASALALTEGFRRGSLVAAGFNVAAIAAALLVVRPAERRTAQTEPAIDAEPIAQPALAD